MHAMCQADVPLQVERHYVGLVVAVSGYALGIYIYNSPAKTIFSASTPQVSFINTTYFIRSLFNVDERSRMQPALIYAGLALTTLTRLSELELRGGGRSRAL